MQKDHFEIVLESIESKIQLVLEGYSVLDKRIQDTRDELVEKITMTDLKVDILNDKIDKVAADLKKTDSKLDKVAADLKKTDKKLDGVAVDLKAHRADTEAHAGTGMYLVKEG